MLCAAKWRHFKKYTLYTLCIIINVYPDLQSPNEHERLIITIIIFF